MDISKKETPTVSLTTKTEAKKLFLFESYVKSLYETPGVTSSVTPLFTIPLAVLGSSSWSHIATRSPALTNFGR